MTASGFLAPAITKQSSGCLLERCPAQCFYHINSSIREQKERCDADSVYLRSQSRNLSQRPAILSGFNAGLCTREILP